MKITKTVIGAILAIFLIGAAVAALTLVSVIHMDGNVITDGGIEVSTNSISWGAVAPDSVQSQSFTVTNVGNAPLTITLETSTLPNGVSVDYVMQDGNALAIGQTKTITVTLTVAPTAPAGIFAYDTTVSGIV